MKKIRAYVDYKDGTHYYNDFEIWEEVPTVEKTLDELIEDTSLTSEYYNNVVYEVEEISIDCEQGNDDVYGYNYYCVSTVDIADYHNDDDEDKDVDDYTQILYVCVEKEEESNLEKEVEEFKEKYEDKILTREEFEELELSDLVVKIDNCGCSGRFSECTWFVVTLADYSEISVYFEQE